MHLINTETLKLESFEGSRTPLYAILSHTWGQDEITFQEIQLGIADTDKRVGYQKITGTCQSRSRMDLIMFGSTPAVSTEKAALNLLKL
jgi:hypothetical protein